MHKAPQQTNPLGNNNKPASFLNLLRYSTLTTSCAIITAIVAAALSIAPFYCLYLIAVELIKPEVDIGKTWGLAALAAGLMLLRWIFVALSDMLAHKGAFFILFKLRLEAAHKLGEVPLSFFPNYGSGNLRRTLSDDIDSLESLYAHILPDLISAPIVSVSAIILLFFADWRLSLAVLVPLPFAFITQWWLSRGLTDKVREWSILQKKITNQVSEYIRGVHVIKSFGLDTRSFGDLAKTIDNAVAWAHDFSEKVARSWVTFSILLRSNIILVAPLGGVLYANEKIELATYLLFLLIAPLALAPLFKLTNALHEKMTHTQAMERINEILTAKPLAENSKTKIPLGPYDINFEQLCHCYNERLALDNVSFTAKAGRITALVGASGSGKSTLIKLVARLYEFESGSLNVGGLDVRDWPLDALLNKTSIVFQDVILLYGSVADNLRIAKPDASDEEIKNACRLAKADDFIMALPEGYDTILNERASQLSGGERQRLSIARAFLKDAPILLLDEPTSSLDPENENLIHEALNTLYRNRTVLLVGHHLQNLTNADNIIVMQHGHVVGQGTHEHLLQSCSTYQHFWLDQQNMNNWSLGDYGTSIMVERRGHP